MSFSSFLFPTSIPLSFPFVSNSQFYLKLTQVPQIHKAKAEAARERILREEMQAKRDKTKAARERRQERLTSKRNALTGADEEEEAKKE